MLLNFSNHPTSTWNENQRKTAIASFGSITDLPFPTIDPQLDSSGIDLMVDQYEIEIRKLDPLAVHIMGELTFTFRLVNRLKKVGYRCVASTTQRIVTNDPLGNKTSTFIFVQFRDY